MFANTSLRKVPRYLGISCLIAGAVFLADPFLTVFDFLPDALGYLLFAIGLYRFSDLDERLGDASRAAGKLALLGVGRLVAVLLTFSIVSNSERPVFLLLMTFTLGVLELILAIPMWRSLSSGFLYLASRTGGTTILSTRRRGARTLIERYAGFSIFFLIVREMAAVLPELTVLTHEVGGNDWSFNSLYNYIGFFRLVGMLIAFIVGIIWLILTIRFVVKLKTDKPFIASLHQKYQNEVLVRHDLLAMRAVKASLVSLGAAAVLALDFYVEGIAIPPDVLAAVMMILSVGFLRRYTQGKHRPAMIVSCLYAVAAAIAGGMQFFYLNFNHLPEVLHDPAIADKLPMYTSVQIMTSTLFAVAFLLILRLLYDLVRQHTGLRALREGSTYASERTESIHTHIRKKLIWVGIFAILAALSAILQWSVIPYLEPIDLPLRPATGEAFGVMMYDFFREAYYVIDIIIGGALVATTIHAGSEIFEQMDYSYLMN